MFLLPADLRKKKNIQFSPEWLRRLEAKGLFPKRVRISARRIGWVESEIDEWLKSKADARDQEAA